MTHSFSRRAQKVKILREADKAPVAEGAKRHGISDQVIYGWRRHYNETRPHSSLGDLTSAAFNRYNSITRLEETIFQA